MSRPGEYSAPRAFAQAKGTVPPGSPWRLPSQGTDASRAPAAGAEAVKLPLLPKLGSQSKAAGGQPTFAQIVQQAQQQPPKSGQKGVPNLATLPKLNSQHARGSASPRPASTPDAGAHILGSVQMMPKVTSSHGMSGLNTVLPGTASAETGRAPAARTPVELPALQSLSLNGENTAPAVAPDFGGLKPLLRVLDAKDGAERQSALLGSDLSQAPLLAGPSTRLAADLASPWQELTKQAVVPDFKLPTCYSIATVVPQQQKLQNFDEGALFYIFYTMPRDAMQEAAAVELTNRSWRYHKELKMWLTKDPMSEPVQTGAQEESGMYIFFDPTSWKKVKREYVLFYPDIAEFVSWKPFAGAA